MCWPQRSAPIYQTTTLSLLSRHHNIPLIDVEAMGSGMTPAQSDYDIHHPRDFYAMASGGDGASMSDIHHLMPSSCPPQLWACYSNPMSLTPATA